MSSRLSRLLPPSLGAALLPFQREGVVFGLERHGRVLIADEMGVGKTVQAIALAACYEVGSQGWPRPCFSERAKGILAAWVLSIQWSSFRWNLTVQHGFLRFLSALLCNIQYAPRCSAGRVAATVHRARQPAPGVGGGAREVAAAPQVSRQKWL